MPKDPDVISGEPVESVWGNQTVRDKLVQRATSASDLTDSWPAPQNGETVWNQANHTLYVFNGTEWVAYAPQANVDVKVDRAGDTMTGTLTARAGGNAWQTLDPTILGSDYAQDGSPTLGYWKDPTGAVHLTGRLANVDPGTIGDNNLMTLPAGVRPTETTLFTIFQGFAGEGIRLQISTTGACTFLTDTGPGSPFALDGIVFRTPV